MATRYLILIGAIVLLGCNQQPKTTFEQSLLIKCINAHGGLDNWNNLSKLNYTKHIILYKENKTVEKELNQTHAYTYRPILTGSITWEDSVKQEIKYQDGEAFRAHNSADSEPDQSSLNSFNSAFYVLNMPWKLIDPNAKISYTGIDTILDNQVVHTLKVEYPKATKQDVWKYYLDYNDYHLVANSVHHGKTYSLIVNDEFVEHKGLKWNAKRTSYMTDSLGNVLYLRAKYVYDYM